MDVENCSNCGRVIGKLEQAYAWQSHILCKECYTRLSSPTLSSPNHQALRRLQKPIDVQLPARSIVKSTLIVMATVMATAIAVSVVIYIILSMPSILSQYSRQTTIDKANKGDAYAQYQLGDMYCEGKGVIKDYKEAIKWYTKAAEQGNGYAQTSLGEMYHHGSGVFEGVPQDDNEAVKWYTKAAEQGETCAQNELGMMYYYGNGVPQDYKEAVKWYTKAAEHGDGYAQNELGEMYYNGNGISQDYIEAYKWVLLSQMNGNNDDTLKEELASKMTPAQIAEAQKLAKEFVERQEKEKSKRDTSVSDPK